MISWWATRPGNPDAVDVDATLDGATRAFHQDGRRVRVVEVFAARGPHLASRGGRHAGRRVHFLVVMQLDDLGRGHELPGDPREVEHQVRADREVRDDGGADSGLLGQRGDLFEVSRA